MAPKFQPPRVNVARESSSALPQRNVANLPPGGGGAIPHAGGANAAMNDPVSQGQLIALANRVSVLESHVSLLESALSVSPSGAVTLTSPGDITIAAQGSLTLTSQNRWLARSGSGTSLVLEQSGAVRVDAMSGVLISAASTVDISTSELTVSAGSVRLNAGLVKCEGVLQAPTLIADTVIASAYTPGAGNIW